MDMDVNFLASAGHEITNGVSAYNDPQTMVPPVRRALSEMRTNTILPLDAGIGSQNMEREICFGLD